MAVVTIPDGGDPRATYVIRKKTSIINPDFGAISSWYVVRAASYPSYSMRKDRYTGGNAWIVIPARRLLHKSSEPT